MVSLLSAKTCIGRFTLFCLAAVALVLQYGCATTVPSVPSQAARDSFGVVAVAPAQYAPQSNVSISWRHKKGATIKQVALEAGGGTATTALVAAAAPIAAPFIILGGVVGTVTDYRGCHRYT